MRLARGVGVVVAVLALLAGPAWAGPSAAEKETARALVREGKTKQKAGDLEGALEDYQAAHAIMGVPTTGLKVGMTQQELGQWVEALDTFLSITRLPAERREPAAFRRARAQAKKLADELSPRIPSVQVAVEGELADGAEVLIDGEAIGAESVGVPFKINPGSHEVLARSGEAEDRVRVEISEGESTEISLRLDQPPDEPALPPKEQPLGPVVLTAVGAGVAGAGTLVGVITGIMATHQATDVATRCPGGQCPPDTHEDLDDAATLGNVSTVAFIVAGVGAVAGTIGLVWMLTGDEEEPELSLVLQPSGLTVRGGF